MARKKLGEIREAIGVSDARAIQKMREVYRNAGVRGDSWTNLYTGIGVKGVDKLTASVFEQRPAIGYNEEFALYRENALARRQVDDLVFDVTHSGFSFVCDDDPELAEEVYEDWKRIDLINACADGLTWGLVCGGAVALLITDDEALDFNNASVMTQPLDATRMGSIQQLLICDSRYAIPNLSNFTTDPTSPNFGNPTTYNVTPFGYSAATPSYTVHWSRIIRFEGMPTDNLTRIANLTWGDSVYQASWDALMRYGMIYQGASLAAAEFGLKIMGMNGLSQLLESDQRTAILNRVAGIKMGLSAARMALIDSQGETLTLASQPVTGLPELMTKQLDEVCMAMHESRSRLFGTAEGELASAEANHKNRAEYVHAWQMMRLVPALTRITQLQFESRNGPKPKPGVKWQIVPNPIDPPNLEKELEQRERQAKVDEMYITQRVLEPSEVRTSRFGGARYSHETNLDPALTGMIEANDKAALDASTEQDKQEETPPPAQA